MAPIGKLAKGRRKRDRTKEKESSASRADEALAPAEGETASSTAIDQASDARKDSGASAAARTKRSHKQPAAKVAASSKRMKLITSKTAVSHQTNDSTASTDAADEEVPAARSTDATAPAEAGKPTDESPDENPPVADQASLPAKKTRAPKMTWNNRYLQLKEYKKENGNCLVPTRFKSNPQLGKWVHNQREQYKMFCHKTKPGYKNKCCMTEERMKLLEEVGFAWSTERSKKQDEDWQARFQQLKQYQEQHGHCMVPHGYTQDPSLYEWVHRQRVQHASVVKSGKEPDQKIKERIDLLKTIGFSFTKQDDVWKERLNELRAYKEQHGNCEVPTHFPENPVLGRWVISQRYEFRKRCKGKKHVITQARIDLLNQLGFNWSVGKPRDHVTWKSRYDELVAFKKQKGHVDVPADQNPQLYRWCRDQKQRLRQFKKHGKDVTKRMGPDRMQALEKIGLVGQLPK